MIENIKKETLQEIKNYNKEFYDYLVRDDFVKLLVKYLYCLELEKSF